jgi:hypothetical protein
MPNFVMVKPKIPQLLLPINSPPLGLPQPEFFVTYGTGGTKLPASYEVLPLPEFHRLLLTEHRAKTEALNELWHPYTKDTPRTRRQQHELIETTFPFVVPGALFDEEADAADEEDEWSGWQTRSGLVVVSFKYPVAETNEVVTLNNRLRLQRQLLTVPLLGPSIVTVFKEPGECLLHALVAADLQKDYWGQVSAITRYLKATQPKLSTRLWGGDQVPIQHHSVGFDLQAYLRPRPAEGYAIFPAKQLANVTEEAESKRRKLAPRQRKARDNK